MKSLIAIVTLMFISFPVACDAGIFFGANTKIVNHNYAGPPSSVVFSAPPTIVYSRAVSVCPSSVVSSQSYSVASCPCIVGVDAQTGTVVKQKSKTKVKHHKTVTKTKEVTK